jgi:hypothetical protein
MNPRIFRCVTAIALFTALAIPVRLPAQQQKEGKEHHRYKVVDLGTFGGPTSYLMSDSNGAGSVSGVINNRGTVVGAADTSTPDPNYGHGSGFFPGKGKKEKGRNTRSGTTG